jgi:hypothetical protein
MVKTVSIALQLDEQFKGVEEDLLEVYRRAALKAINFMQMPVQMGGHMPVRTQFLRSSGYATLAAATRPLMDNPNPHGYFTWSIDEAKNVIYSASLKDKITFAYQARYAVYQNYGARGKPGHLFVDLTAQAWPTFVDEAVKEVKASGKSK